MYKEIVKCPKRQDCHFKLTPGTSNETSINLSNDVLHFINPDAQLGDTVPITFKLHKEDFIKALCFIVTKLPLYTTNSRNSSRIDYSNDFFESELMRINTFFQHDEEDYIVSLYYREDGRIYLKDLTYHHFNIRKFLIENKTSMHFIVCQGIDLRMQYSDNPTEDSHIVSESLAVRDNILKDFIYKTVYLLNKIDGLKALEPYVKELSENIQLAYEDHFKLTGMFIATTIKDIAARNKYGEKPRWFKTPFKLCDKTVYLSTQWYGTGKYALTYNDFTQLVERCYNGRFQCRKKDDGEFELWEISINTATSYPEESIRNLPICQETFRIYLDHFTQLGIKSKTSYLGILERDSIINMYNMRYSENIASLYDIENSKKLQNLITLKQFVEFDQKAHHQYSCALKYYIDFLRFRLK